MIIDIAALFRLLLNKVWIIILCSVIMGSAAFGLSKRYVAEQYRASVTMYVNNKGSMEGTATLTTGDLSASVHLVDTYSVIIRNPSMLHEVAEMADVGWMEKWIENYVNVYPLNNTEVFQVDVIYEDPVIARRIADAIALIAPVRIAEIVEGSSVKVVSYVQTPDESVGPSYLGIAAFGAMAGMVLSVVVVIIRALMDTRVKSEADFTQWHYPLLGSIPDLSDVRRKKGYGYGYGYGYGDRKQRKR